MYFKQTKLIFLGAILAAFSANLAHAQTKTGSDTRYIGNAKVGAKLHTYGELKQRSNLVRAFGKITAYTRLFNKTYETVGVEAKSQVLNGKSSNIAKVKLAGFTVHSKSKPYGWKWDWDHTQTFFEKEKTVFVNGIPINLEIRTGGTLYSNLYLGACIIGGGMHGKTGVKAWGTAFAGLDFVALRIGVKANITLLNNYLQLNSTLTPKRLTGDFKYILKTLKVVLKLVLDKAKVTRKGFKIKRSWKKIGSKQITQYWKKGNISHTFLSW